MEKDIDGIFLNDNQQSELKSDSKNKGIDGIFLQGGNKSTRTEMSDHTRKSSNSTVETRFTNESANSESENND